MYFNAFLTFFLFIRDVFCSTQNLKKSPEGTLISKIFPFLQKIVNEMLKNSQLGEIIISTSDKSLSRDISRLKSEGRIKKIAARVYTSNLTDSPEEIVKRNLFDILGRLFPDSVISHRSAFELRPTEDGHIFLTYQYSRNISLPGITVHLIEGYGAISSDIPFISNLHISSPSRAFLENLQLSYQKGGVSKCLTQSDIEQRLEKKLDINGETELNRIRDDARVISEQLGLKQEFLLLDKIIGALLSTREAAILKSESAIARAIGQPFDSERFRLFDIFFNYLSNKEFVAYPEKNLSEKAYKNFGFFESYFSNYIEGTTFEIEEARRIVETGVPIPTRDEDSHDVLGTFYIVSSKKEMSVTPKSYDELIEILRKRHSLLLSARPWKNPGMFKESNNRAGDSHFVDYRLVPGTLRKGFEFYQALSNPIARAYFMLFMISEIHPFNDGNGRVSRIMMNAELTSSGNSKIIIPTVYRTDYLDALRRLTRANDPSVLVRAMERVRLFGSMLDGSDYNALHKFLVDSNAFKEEEQYILRF